MGRKDPMRNDTTTPALTRNLFDLFAPAAADGFRDIRERATRRFAGTNGPALAAHLHDRRRTGRGEEGGIDA